MKRLIPSRAIPIEVGNDAWTISHPPYGCPAALGHNTRVEVLVVPRPNPDFHYVVRDTARRVWRLKVGQITAGLEYELEPGKWWPESHARARAHLRHQLALPIDHDCQALRRYREDARETMRDQLARYDEPPV